MELIGQVNIDTATLVLGDPCAYETLGELFPTEDYIVRDGCVAVATGLGDGNYPVYIEYMDCGKMGKRVSKVIVDFNQGGSND